MDSIIYLDFIYFCDNKSDADKKDENYDQLWNMGTSSDKGNMDMIYYTTNEHLSVNNTAVYLS